MKATRETFSPADQITKENVLAVDATFSAVLGGYNEGAKGVISFTLPVSSTKKQPSSTNTRASKDPKHSNQIVFDFP